MAQASAPWDSASPEEQVFVLVTGANSGVGLGICKRLADDFLVTRSSEAHLVIVPVTRSVSKARETATAVRAHVLQSRIGREKHGAGRIHLASVQLDLGDLRSVYAASERLKGGTVDYYGFAPPTRKGGVVAAPEVASVRIPRLDAVIFNAGVGGWTHLSWLQWIWAMFAGGLLAALTWPAGKISRVGAVIAQDVAGKPCSSNHDRFIGQVFCTNVFGHYLFAHELMALLSRAPGDAIPRGRIIWTSSVEPTHDHFSLDDVQGIRSRQPYESSKRLTDVLALTANLPGPSRAARPFFAIEDERDAGLAGRLTVRPRLCVTHPGIVVSTFFPVPFIFMSAYTLGMYLARLLGSPWHPVTGYLGGLAASWAALKPESDGDIDKLEGVKWGSSTDRRGRPAVKKTEVEGWAWEGVVEDKEALAKDVEVGVLRKLVGRRPNMTETTTETREAFEELGAKCWLEMERLRREWEDRLAVREGGGVSGGTPRREC